MLEDILERFHLPLTYQQIRTHDNASSAFFKFTERGSRGSVQRVGKFPRQSPFLKED